MYTIYKMEKGAPTVGFQHVSNREKMKRIRKTGSSNKNFSGFINLNKNISNLHVKCKFKWEDP